METGTINNFIKKDLIKKIRSDAKASKTIIPKITNERDLESAIYYHLRKKLKGSKDLKISTNYTFSGVKKRHETTFVQPDIIISQWIDDFHPKFIESPELTDPKSKGYPKPLIAFELKSEQPGNSIFREKMQYQILFKKTAMQKDFRKLNDALRKGYIENGYFFYLYHDMYISEKNIKKIIEESIKNKQRFDVIVINRFKITKSESKSALETRQRLRQLGRFYTENDHRKIWEICEVCGKFVQEHTLKEDKVCFPDKTRRKKSKPNNKRSAAAKKAARTKKRKEKAAKAKRSAAAKKAAQTRKRNTQKRKKRSK